TIYHEHLCYFSLSAVTRLFEGHDLRVVDVTRLPIHGGSLRVVAARSDTRDRATDAVASLLAEEQAWEVTDVAPYAAFAERVQRLRHELTSLLRGLKADGASIAAYGAAAKGSTLLNTFGIGTDILDFVVDRSTYKQGRFMPGVHIPIHSTERLVQ